VRGKANVLENKVTFCKHSDGNKEQQRRMRIPTTVLKKIQCPAIILEEGDRANATLSYAVVFVCGKPRHYSLFLISSLFLTSITVHEE
jgi:hypothetical protein